MEYGVLPIVGIAPRVRGVRSAFRAHPCLSSCHFVAIAESPYRRIAVSSCRPEAQYSSLKRNLRNLCNLRILIPGFRGSSGVQGVELSSPFPFAAL
jgi:hypothetical protein